MSTMALSSRINSVRNFLASHYMFVDAEWLSGCVEYLTEDSSTNYSEAEIQNLAKEQWLLNDLNDICPGSLPANLKNQIKVVLDGRFVLQINAAEDIGTPAYQQYLKLQKINMENVDATAKFEDKVHNHRMIKLYLTDGVQEISAIEYKPMRNLSCDITPGCKVLIKGPIECRRGVLLLTESAIELLGGEVQEIAICNSLAGLLSTKLGLPITQEPEPNTTISEPRNTNLPLPHTDMPSAVNEWSQQPEPTRPVARVTSLQVANFDDDIDFDQLAAIEAQYNESPAKRSLEYDDSKPEKKLKMETTQPSSSAQQLNEYPDDDDMFLDDEDYFREMEAKFDATESDSRTNMPVASGPVIVSSEPFVYIKQINDMSEGDKAGRVFRIKAQIMKLLSKLSVGKEGWSLRCTLVDGSGALDAEFSSAVLAQLVGFTPAQMTQLKKDMATKPELKLKAVSALQKAKDTLQVLYCIIELTILEVPKITNLVPFEQSHVDLLKKRLTASGL